MTAHSVDLDQIHALIHAGLPTVGFTLTWATEATERLDAEVAPSVIAHPVTGRGQRFLGYNTTDRIGQMLVNANLHSLDARHPNAPMPPAVVYHYHTPVKRFSVGEILATISEYEDQCRHVPGWGQSEAYAFCRALRTRVTENLSDMLRVDAWQSKPEVQTSTEKEKN